MPEFNLENDQGDPEIPGQKFVCLSYAPHITLNTLYFKVRGSFATFEEAQERAMELHQNDPMFNIYIGEVGKFLPAQSNMINLSAPSQNFFQEETSVPENESDNPNPFNIPINLISELNGTGSSENGDECGTESGDEENNVVEDNNNDSESSSEGDLGACQEVGVEVIKEEAEAGGDDMDKQPICLACRDTKRDTLFLPCRHVCFCLSCSNMHIKKSSRCPICRTSIEEMINVFIN